MPVRPTPDSLRERAFSVLGETILDADFLDLFAGTGAVGLEALSRGARGVVFVEPHRGVAKILRANCAAFELDRDEAHIMNQTALKAIAALHRRGRLFNLVWADPPFEHWEDGLRAVLEVFSRPLLAVGGRACFECPDRSEVAPMLPDELEVQRILDGGASRLVIIGRRDHS
jgi:16S rRNA (guanine(966)-N(2))-methyltransferase RsmD